VCHFWNYAKDGNKHGATGDEDGSNDKVAREDVSQEYASEEGIP
jgi:hypothetical protein